MHLTLWQPPTARDFDHPSECHGVAHVTRVMVLARRLLEATAGRGGFRQVWAARDAAALWAAVYLHDLARTHDGACRRHGLDAIIWLDGHPVVELALEAGGVRREDWPAIKTAVIHHCRPDRDLDAAHPDWWLLGLLKDADGLDRVRLGPHGLDPWQLRHPEAKRLVPFAHTLYSESVRINARIVKPGRPGTVNKLS